MAEILHQLRLVVFPIIYRVSYIPGGAGFQPSTVWTCFLVRQLHDCVISYLGFLQASACGVYREADLDGSIKTQLLNQMHSVNNVIYKYFFTMYIYIYIPYLADTSPINLRFSFHPENCRIIWPSSPAVPVCRVSVAWNTAEKFLNHRSLTTSKCDEHVMITVGSTKREKKNTGNMIEMCDLCFFFLFTLKRGFLFRKQDAHLNGFKLISFQQAANQGTTSQ